MSTSYHRENLRQELIDQAIKTLQEDGVEKLSLRALARDLGVSHSAPLRHFATKADLFRTLAQEGVQDLTEKTVQAMVGEHGLERLMQMAVAYVDWAHQNPAYHQVLRIPDVMRHRSDELHEYLEGFSTLIKKETKIAQENGWNSDVETGALILHIISLTAGTALTITEPLYSVPLKEGYNRERIIQSLRLFFS